MCEEGSVFYEINGEAFSNLIKYNHNFFKNFIKKSNARENFRMTRKSTAVDEYHVIQDDKRSTKLKVDKNRFDELKDSGVGEFVRQFTNNMYERNIKNKMDIIKSKEEAGDIKKVDPNKSFEVENFSDGKRKTQIAEERKRKAKLESVRTKKVETGINFTMETRLVKSILSTNSRLKINKPKGG